MLYVWSSELSLLLAYAKSFRILDTRFFQKSRARLIKTPHLSSKNFFIFSSAISIKLHLIMPRRSKTSIEASRRAAVAHVERQWQAETEEMQRQKKSSNCSFVSSSSDVAFLPFKNLQFVYHQVFIREN